MPPKRRKTSTKGKKAKQTKKANTNPPASLTSAFSEDRCRAWWQTYADLDDGAMMQENGTMKLCEDLDVTPEHVLMLTVAWKLDCKTMGEWSSEEWMVGMSELDCDNAAKLQAKLPALHAEINNQPMMKSLFRFSYDYARSINDNVAQRSIDRETTTLMLNVLLRGRWVGLAKFLQFLEDTDVKVVNKDQWCSVYEFSHTILADFSNYDELEAWPIMLDDFVEWSKDNGSGGGGGGGGGMEF